MHHEAGDARTVKVQKARLIEQLQSNRERHQREYQEALAGYRGQLVTALTRKLERAKRKEAVDHTIDLVPPQDRSPEYDRALAILDWEEDDILELPLSDFEAYVLDNWPWKAGFKELHAAYIGGAPVVRD